MSKINLYDKCKMFLNKNNTAVIAATTIIGAGIIVGAQYLPATAPEKSVVMDQDIEVNSINESNSKPLISEIDYNMTIPSNNDLGYENVIVKDIAFTVEDIMGNKKLLASRDLDKNYADIKQIQALLYTINISKGTSSALRQEKVYATAYLVYNEDGTKEYHIISDLKDYANTNEDTKTFQK